MEPPESSPPQPLPEGEEKEVKEADELKLGVAKDTGQGKENLKEADGVKLDTEPQPISLVVSSIAKGKEQMKEADEEELDAPKENDQSSMAAQRHLTKEGGEIEEHHVDARMSSESRETDSDEVKLDVAEHSHIQKSQTSAALDVESPMADQRKLGSEGFFHNFRKKLVRVCSLCRTGDGMDLVSGHTGISSWLLAGLRHSFVLTMSGERRRRRRLRSIVRSSDEETSSIIEGESAAMMSARNIHKVHPGLRSYGEIAKHYEPILVSIGFYHHGKEALQDMERKKKQYMQVLLERVKETSIDVYVKALENGGELEQALHCYVDTFTVDVNSLSFGECVVLDGLFVIEIFRRTKKFKDYDDKDMFFTMEWMKSLLQRDLLLFENQIPLFVLRQLFKLTNEINSEMDFVELALGFFFNEKRISHKEIEMEQLDNIPHLLGLVYEALLVRKRGSVRKKSWDPIWSAEALEEVGVAFVRADDDAAIYDINFNSGTFRIPRLVIADNTESMFRNLVAYEQYSNKCSLHQITNYLQVMDYLINTPKDVELLRHCGIIDNMLGDDVKVSTMFSQISSGVLFNKDEFFYAEMFDEVNKFCKRRRNVWMKKLKNEYFGSPWTLISFTAAVTLLVLTVTQTVFSVISHYKQY